jgi:hypothetical protein
MMHVDNGRGSLSPRLQQQRDTRFSLLIVARSPRRVVETDLHVYHDERR